MAVKKKITIVSGLPRSGTSMMMQMLEAGGMKPVTDRLRHADEDNPKGYYELEEVKRLEKNPDAILAGRGKVVKVISFLLKHLPGGEKYNIVFLRRDIREILRSQKKMLERRGVPDTSIPDEEMGTLLTKDLQITIDWLEKQPNMEVLFVEYKDVVSNPEEHAARVNDFLGGTLEEHLMQAVVDSRLHRQQ